MDMDIDTTTSAQTMARTKSAKATTQATSTAAATPTVLTRLCDAQSEHFYIYLTIEMEPQAQSQHTTKQHELSILTFRKMLSSAVQDLFGTTMGGGINIDILGFWTSDSQDPYNRPLFPSSSFVPATLSTTNIPTATVTVTSTYSATTAASAVLRCHALDVNQLWNSLTLFNTLVDDYEARFEVRYVSSTLLGLQANSRQLKWFTS